ncbi:Protein kinase [Spraguea lophii 42_110]|uniref:Protein kinase n=1 Tax=Spraguea lophii (strain 42_110) TaxID=1358809 RepID=S7WC41_SPRLO|nr:Protein kinase [Spraguea lophii 42_110]
MIFWGNMKSLISKAYFILLYVISIVILIYFIFTRKNYNVKRYTMKYKLKSLFKKISSKINTVRCTAPTIFLFHPKRPNLSIQINSGAQKIEKCNMEDIYLYKADIPNDTVRSPTEIGFGHANKNPCCFPESLHEFEDNFAVTKSFRSGELGEVSAIITKCCSSQYALKVVIVDRYEMLIKSGYYHRDIYFAKYFMLYEHSSIVKYLQVYYQGSKVYVITELLNNGDLSEINFFGEEYNEKMLDEYIISIFLGIAHLHKHKIIHGDIKPDNICIANDLQAKLIDFDCSVKIDSGYDTMIRNGFTELYLAPEERNYYVLELQYKCDWWAFGCVLYHLIENTNICIPSTNSYECCSLKKMKLNSGNKVYLNFQNKKIKDDLKDLVICLLEPDTEKRLGCGDNATLNILQHPYFKNRFTEETMKEYQDSFSESNK